MDQYQNALVVRADASTQIGTGHVMRCLAICQAWQDSGGRVTFIMAPGARSLEERLVSEGMEILRMLAQPGTTDDANQTVSLAQKLDASWVVVDGYHFGADYQRILKNSGQRVLAIDDYGHANHYYADFVLNQNLYSDENVYPNREPYTQLLLGLRYALVRREFFNGREWKLEIPRVARKILVTLGGSDPKNVSLNVIQALQDVKIDGLQTVVVVGGTNPHYQELQSAVRYSKVPIRLEHNVAAMPGLMAWADVAISAAGTTAWELVFMGVPTLFLVLADNQRETAKRLDELGIARNLGRSDLYPSEMAHELVNLLLAAERRTEMTCRSRELVDGDGAARVLKHLNAQRLHIRKIREDDCRQLWEWANDPDVRAVSFSSEPIPWEQHIEWFRSKLNDPTCVLQIATNDREIPVGQVRYNLDGDQAVISISLDREFRGKGYGSLLIWRSAQKLFATTAVTTIHAYVKQCNKTSLLAFEKAGYRNLEWTTVKNHDAVHLVFSRSGQNAR